MTGGLLASGLLDSGLMGQWPYDPVAFWVGGLMYRWPFGLVAFWVGGFLGWWPFGSGLMGDPRREPWLKHNFL